MFHYSAPTSRSTRNRVAYECVLNLALCEFISRLATGIPAGRCENGYGVVFRHDFSIDIAELCISQAENDFQKKPALESMTSYEFHDAVYTKLHFLRDPQSRVYQFYFGCWKGIRNRMIHNSIDVDPVLRYVLALDVNIATDEEFEQAFSEKVKAVIDFHPLEHIVKTFLAAFIEVSPDIFDLGVVLNGEEKINWARQYFWQISSIRGDLQFGVASSSRQCDDVVAYISANGLDANAIRIGMILSYCLDDKGDIDERVCMLREHLNAWCKNEHKEADFLSSQKQFCYDYQTYLEQFGNVANYAKQLSEQAAAALLLLQQDDSCVQIIKKLSAFYARYYAALDNRQRAIDSDFDASHFSLCTEIIEYYQEQISIEDLCNQSLSTLAHFDNSKVKRNTHLEDAIFGPPQHYFVDHPADLARAIKTAYDSMTINGKIPALWYRGERIYARPSIPNIMRMASDDGCGFINLFREEVRLARSQILPVGQEFSPAEWLAFLQHNGFKTTILDFSEELHPALYFAVEKWITGKEPPRKNACIEIFNPLLFNLAMEAMDAAEGTDQRKKTKTIADIENYLKKGTRCDRRMELPLFSSDEDNDEYETYFDYKSRNPSPEKADRPRAALVPKNSERMKKQSGQFVFYDVYTKPRKDGTSYTYDYWSIERLHTEYINFANKNLFRSQAQYKVYIKPFLFQMEISSTFHAEFVKYVKAIGLSKRRVYPEYDNLAKDLRLQLEMD